VISTQVSSSHLPLNILKGFEKTEEVNIFQRRVGATKEHDLKLFKKRVVVVGLVVV